MAAYFSPFESAGTPSSSVSRAFGVQVSRKEKKAMTMGNRHSLKNRDIAMLEGSKATTLLFLL